MDEFKNQIITYLKYYYNFHNSEKFLTTYFKNMLQNSVYVLKLYYLIKLTKLIFKYYQGYKCLSILHK